jgi:predicted nuclease with TOPRIM domain
MRKNLSPTHSRYRKKKTPQSQEPPAKNISFKSILILFILTSISIILGMKFYKNIQELKEIDIKLNNTRYQILSSEETRIIVNKEADDLETKVKRLEQKIKQLKEEEELLNNEYKKESERVIRLNKTIENYIAVDKQQNESLILENKKMNEYKLAIENLNNRINDVRAIKEQSNK